MLFMNVQPAIQSPEQLLAGARNLDADVLGAIHDRFYPLVFKYIRYRTLNEAVSEDLTGEVFLRLVEALRRGVGPSSNLQGWLFSTASHLIADHLRRKYSRPESELGEEEVSLGESPEEQVEKGLMRSRLMRAMNDLKPHEQHVLTLRFSEELSLEEVAQVMKKSVGAVKVLQFRAVAALRKAMERGQG